MTLRRAIVTVYEIHKRKFFVEGEFYSALDAVSQVMETGDYVQSPETEYCEVAEGYGMPVELLPELEIDEDDDDAFIDDHPGLIDDDTVSGVESVEFIDQLPDWVQVKEKVSDE